MGADCGCIWGVGAAILILLFPTEAGKIFGLLEFCAGFGQMAGPPFGSFLFSLGGYRFPFWTAGLIEITAGVFCVACLLTRTIHRRQVVGALHLKIKKKHSRKLR